MRRAIAWVGLPAMGAAALLAALVGQNGGDSAPRLVASSPFSTPGSDPLQNCDPKITARADQHVFYGRVVSASRGELSDVKGLGYSTLLVVDVAKMEVATRLVQPTPDVTGRFPFYTRSVAPDDVRKGDCVIVAGRTRFLDCGTGCVLPDFWADEVKAVPRPY